MLTATEALALAGIVLSALLGYLGYRTAADARQDAKELAAEGRKSAADEARIARQFDSRRKVYVDVMDYVYRLDTYIARTEPILTFDGAPQPPTFPPEEDARHQSAEIASFGSPDMLKLLNAYRDAANAFQSAVFVLRSQRQAYGEGSAEALKAWGEVQEKRQATKPHVEALVAQVNEELSR